MHLFTAATALTAETAELTAETAELTAEAFKSS